MNVGDYVFVINPADEYYSYKFIIRAVALDFNGRITGYTVNGVNGRWRDYLITDLQYTPPQGVTFTSQMQLL